MKATIEFDLNEPDDIIAHHRCVKSQDMALALWEIRYNLRRNCERLLENLDDSGEFSQMDIVFEQLNEIFSDHNINVDELIL